MTRLPPQIRLKFRSVFISDVHLGSRDSGARYLLDFLRRAEVQQLYLVGDIIDLWSLSRSVYWPREHGEVIAQILSMAQNGTRVIYVPGNHDVTFRRHVGQVFGGVPIVREAEHATADGRKFLVMHGDEYDGAIRIGSWLSRVGSGVYSGILWLHRHLNGVRRLCRMPYWSLAAYLKLKSSKAVTYIRHFEEILANEAARRGFDGVICGHIHRAAIANIDGAQYMNCGDWVESCTALTEDHQGRFAILHWSEQPAMVQHCGATSSADLPISRAA